MTPEEIKVLEAKAAKAEALEAQNKKLTEQLTVTAKSGGKKTTKIGEDTYEIVYPSVSHPQYKDGALAGVLELTADDIQKASDELKKELVECGVLVKLSKK